jgi:hypothetical protein
MFFVIESERSEVVCKSKYFRPVTTVYCTSVVCKPISRIFFAGLRLWNFSTGGKWKGNREWSTFLKTGRGVGPPKGSCINTGGTVYGSDSATQATDPHCVMCTRLLYLVYSTPALPCCAGILLLEVR